MLVWKRLFFIVFYGLVMPGFCQHLLAADAGVLLTPIPPAIHLEAEEAELAGPEISTSRNGFSGTSYVTGFKNELGRIVWTIPDAEPGIYDVWIRYASPYGNKECGLSVNGSRLPVMLQGTPELFALNAGPRVELQRGINIISIDNGWGYFDVDAIDLVPAWVDRAVKKPPNTTADPEATMQTRALLSSLIEVYGDNVLAGQQTLAECDYIKKTTGKLPAIIGGDLIEYSPSRIAHGANPENHVEQMMKSARQGYTITMAWHWNAPTGLIDQEKTSQ